MSRNATILDGGRLPHIVTPIPGPQSRELAHRLSLVESRNITCMLPEPPIFWADAHGANVRDVDGNIYIDLTAGFGVTNAGHSNHAVVNAIQQQAASLPHALGDVHPAEIKIRFLERLRSILPTALHISILANSGAEAVEAALKTAVIRTGRPGILAFRNAYHGLTYGALATTHRAHFREAFEQQLFAGVRFATFPSPADSLEEVLREIDEVLETNAIGAILVEPIQGRGGIVVPHDGFLAALRERCDGESRLLIFDEIYTGCGRTGKWLACEHWNVVPDIVTLGKALSGSLPISVCVGTESVMNAWPLSHGEAIHTSTFLGNPIACAAAIAQLDEIESGDLLGRARAIGERIRERASAWPVETRGIGLLQGLVTEHAIEICTHCLAEGVLILAEGSRADVLAITPPAVITDEQLDYALDLIERTVSRFH